jgi:hypothetical protein
MFNMAPYLRLAKEAGEENHFYEIFFKVWFERWPETHTNDSEGGSISSVEGFMDIVKKVRSTSNTLNVAMVILTYFLNRILRVIIHIF